MMSAIFGRQLFLTFCLAGTVLFSQSDTESRGGSAPAPLQFTSVWGQAGLSYGHRYVEGLTTEARKCAGGVAVGDYDRDGLLDLYVVRGDSGPNLLFRNRGDGTFEETAQAAGLALTGQLGSGPTFADWDGDNWPDLLIGGLEGTPPRLFRNVSDGTFEEVTAQSGVTSQVNTFSAAFGDYDRDGDLDLFLTHWMGGRDDNQGVNHLWRNNGDGSFAAVGDEEAGLGFFQIIDYSFTPNFADINTDGWPDLLVSADFGTSQVFLNRQDGTFENITDEEVITDQNGMGSAVGDIDHDGDLDWFVSSIFDPDPEEGLGWGTTGNRLYRNQGDGTFEDITTESGVREGFWGWGSCFADFDNDGNLDLFHVNGFYPPSRDGVPISGEIFTRDPSRLFMSNGDGTFTERSAQMGIDDRAQGRGLVCFDYDRDGDIDIFVANNTGPPSLFRNDGGNQNNFLSIALESSAGRQAIGARIYVKAQGVTQMREIRAGSSYVSQQPEEAHFGLGSATAAQEVKIHWPGGALDTYRNVAANQRLSLGRRPVQVLTPGHRLVFPHAPAGGSADSVLTLLNTNHSMPVRGALSFTDPSGNERSVTLQGLGTDSRFELEIPAGGSLALEATSQGDLSLGMASFSSDFPVEGVWRFQIGNSHIGVANSPTLHYATLPVQTSDGFNTGLALSNPGDVPLDVELALLDEEGQLLETVVPETLPAMGQTARFLTEFGFSQAADRSSGSVQIRAKQGGSFAALALLSGKGTLSSVPVAAGAAGSFSFEQFQGSYTGSWTNGPDSGGQVALAVGTVPSLQGISLRFTFTGLFLGIQDLGPLDLFGFYDQDGLQALGQSPVLGPLSLTILPDGSWTLSAQDPIHASITSFVMTGSGFPDTIDTEYSVMLANQAQMTGTIVLNHSGN